MEKINSNVKKRHPVFKFRYSLVRLSHLVFHQQTQPIVAFSQIIFFTLVHEVLYTYTLFVQHFALTV